jgi:iron(III) transport system substrate-binding protein
MAVCVSRAGAGCGPTKSPRKSNGKARKLAPEGETAAFVVPAEGVTAYDYYTGIASTATSTASAKVFMNWNLSKRGQQVFSDMGEYSVRSDIAAPHVRGIQLPDFDDPRVHRITPAEAIANAADDQKIWNAIFGYNE